MIVLGPVLPPGMGTLKLPDLDAARFFRKVSRLRIGRVAEAKQNLAELLDLLGIHDEIGGEEKIEVIVDLVSIAKG